MTHTHPKLPDQIELVVVGAHLSGMPLNPELLAHEARFLRAARTAPVYRLYALAGTQPAKPGMVRVSPDRGAGIEVEVWSMPPAGFGRFVAAIPSPLGVGTILLEDGTAAKGFLAESFAIADAHDVTEYGGWRAYRSAVSAA
ncbi:allophanate hydrolase-related protein [Pelagibacterium montanilacus]|uniref:allophanate hydrolase-related protein n=1 Tax=Pelagibacterium montanilacus TaxID=2185280 RepID=UPI000F8E5CD3|nr:hypothetical protein [Pelagibacterium montanilacus]